MRRMEYTASTKKNGVLSITLPLFFTWRRRASRPVSLELSESQITRPLVIVAAAALQAHLILA
jgi:hypothetical protein